MFRPLPYTALLITLILLQLFVFDKLLITTTVAPMVYVAFIVLLPMRTSQISMLMWGVAIGMLFDFMTGMSGLNSIATMFVSYTRIWVLNFMLGKDVVMTGAIPTPRAIGAWKFSRYMLVMVFLHSIILFSVEFLRFGEFFFLVRRILFSGIVSTLFVWLIARQFEQIVPSRRI